MPLNPSVAASREPAGSESITPPDAKASAVARARDLLSRRKSFKAESAAHGPAFTEVPLPDGSTVRLINRERLAWAASVANELVPLTRKFLNDAD
jgi:hypothetical protein